MTQMTVTNLPYVQSRRALLPQASLLDTLGIINTVILPTIAKGVIIRRPSMVALAEWLDWDQRAVRYMQYLRNKYQPGPLLLRIPIRSQAVILAPHHVHRVLNGSPEPFATASSEKRAALAHFQPQGVLVSHGVERADRRRFNEQVLDTGQTMHRLTARFIDVVNEEAVQLLQAAQQRGLLVWEDFADTWFRVVRRVVFGDAARHDYELTELINRLRSDANWAFLMPQRRHVRDQFYVRLHQHLARAEAGSLAGVMASTHATAMTAPDQQVPQWLFAFDPTGMATFRTLALLATHPAQMAQARGEIQNTHPDRPYLRACVLDALRLWPTAPMVLRQSTVPTEWETGIMPAQTGIAIYAPFFHRDDQRLPYANRFTPELWMRHRTDQDWPLIPFSGGPAMCPGRNLVLLLSSALLAALLHQRQVRLQPENRLDARQPLPGTLNNYSLRFTIDR
jgi:cytochrome P450